MCFSSGSCTAATKRRLTNGETRSGSFFPHALSSPGESPWEKHPRIQLLTIEDLLGGKTVDYPQATDVTFKKAQRVRSKPSEKQKILPMEGEPPEDRNE